MPTRLTSLKNRALKAAAVTSMTLVVMAGGTSAANAAEVGGSVPGGVSAQACVAAGGGTWCYGTSADGLLKRCYSNYVHPTNYHSSTASMASQVSKRYAGAGAWSQAQVTAGWAYTCYTYYDPTA